MERKIYNGWAFTENEAEKGKVNREIFQELKTKYKVYRDDINFNPTVNLDEYDVVIGREPGYHHAVYNIVKNAPDLSTDELLLLCDGGNLCFGGSRKSNNHLRVSED
ncbi:hypothetical protein [Cytobacillus solani]|uniref:Uncharacterized protein n=1 Tax=Cytobacillus solani TaxID=1637975 RepID=A0A0Q3QQQ6_9BACI|nr:hypothetical protein [Cytobacillus solani]KQL20497.1 hypothetical protein AN957_19175 [Cytobacillus solani]